MIDKDVFVKHLTDCLVDRDVALMRVESNSREGLVIKIKFDFLRLLVAHGGQLYPNFSCRQEAFGFLSSTILTNSIPSFLNFSPYEMT
jgi:hypothetical protein